MLRSHHPAFLAGRHQNPHNYVFNNSDIITSGQTAYNFSDTLHHALSLLCVDWNCDDAQSLRSKQLEMTEIPGAWVPERPGDEDPPSMSSAQLGLVHEQEITFCCV